MNKQAQPSAQEPDRTSDAPKPRLTMTLLRETTYPIPDWDEVAARLWRMEPDPRRVEAQPTYAVEMRGQGLARTYCIGQNAARAEEIFELLTRHTVTPCALLDVLEELLEEDVTSV